MRKECWILASHLRATTAFLVCLVWEADGSDGHGHGKLNWLVGAVCSVLMWWDFRFLCKAEINGTWEERHGKEVRASSGCCASYLELPLSALWFPLVPFQQCQDLQGPAWGLQQPPEDQGRMGLTLVSSHGQCVPWATFPMDTVRN